MKNSNLKIECHKLNDDGSMVYQPMSNLDGLIWNGAYIIRSFNDNGSWGLPFTLADNEAVNLVVKDQAQKREATTDAQRVVVQTITRVEKETGEVLTYSRTRRNVGGTQVWSEWSYLTADSTSDIKPNSVSTEKLAAEVRDKINNPLRPLFIAAGAEYNDTGTDKTKTAPWGETVTHKAGHYYLNGLGDITEEEMAVIVNKGEATSISYNMVGYKGRTNLFLQGHNSLHGMNGYFWAYLCKSEVLNLAITTNPDTHLSRIVELSDTDNFISYCDNLKHVVGAKITFRDGVSIGTNICASPNIVTIFFYGISNDLSLYSCKKISKDSVLYIINNATPTTAITITLHQDAYARLADDAEIVAALEAQPLVSLVSA